MPNGRALIPYDVALRLIDGNRGPIDHDYDFWGNELIFVLEGAADLYRDDLLIPLRKGDIIILTGTYVKRFHNAVNLQIFNVFFWDAAMQRSGASFLSMEGYQILFVQNPKMLAYDKNNRLRVDDIVLDELRPLVRLMEMEQYSKRTGYEQVLNSAFFALVTLISRAFADNASFQYKTFSGVNCAASYIQMNYRDPITLDDLTALSGLSERQFTRKFKEEFHESPIQYLVHQRISHACQLLENSDLSISDIAMECGFNDINYFSKSFKRVHNMPPSEYRLERLSQIQNADWRKLWMKDIRD